MYFWRHPYTVLGYDQGGNPTTQTLAADGVWTEMMEFFIEGQYVYYEFPWPYNKQLKNATATYDALGRLVSWAEAGGADMPGASTTYEYDANGNVRRSLSQFHALSTTGAPASGWTTQDYWYRYDSLNRVVTTKGQLSGGAIVRGAAGADITYDLSGQRASVQTNASTETYSYDS